MRGLAQRCIEQAGRQGQSAAADHHIKWQTVHLLWLIFSEADPVDLQIVYRFRNAVDHSDVFEMVESFSRQKKYPRAGQS